MEDVKSISTSGRGRPRVYVDEDEKRKHKNEMQRLRLQKKKADDPDYGKKQYLKYKNKYNQCLLHITDPAECNGKFCMMCKKDIESQTNFIQWNLRENKPVSDTVKHTDLLTYITATIGTDEKFPKVATKYIQYCANHKRWLKDLEMAKKKPTTVEVKPIVKPEVKPAESKTVTSETPDENSDSEQSEEEQ